MKSDTFKKLRSNPLFIIGSVIILLNLLIVFGGANMRPDSSKYANEQHLVLGNLPPLSTVSFIHVLNDTSSIPDDGVFSFFVGKTPIYTAIPVDKFKIKGDILIYNRLGDPEDGEIKLNEILSDSEGNYVWRKKYWMGADRYGRDMLSRLMSGTYISFSVGLISVFISLVIGITLGLFAGYYRGWLDSVIVWFINVIWSVPTLLLVIAVTLVLGKGFWQIFIAVGLTMWVEVARVVRGQVLSVREKEYVEAGKVLGFSDRRIIFKHILPNVISPVIVISAANFATAILLEAGLSFLGIGAPPPQATWGKMISEHKAFLITGDAHLAILPGIAIMLLVLSFTFIGNGLRDAMDVRSTSN